MRSNYFSEYFGEAVEVISSLQHNLVEISAAAEIIVDSLRNGNCIFWFGNGGSASDAQHLAAELVGRFEKNRRAFASISLNTDTSVLTALSNDFGYETVFIRQIEALAKPGDVAVGISTSGKSKNVVSALAIAKTLGLSTIAFTGEHTKELLEHCDIVLSVASNRTCHIQEAHIAIGQAICGYVEEKFEIN